MALLTYTTNSVPPYIPDQNQDGEQPGVNEPYLDFIDYLLGLDDPPTGITTSYGDDEQTVPQDYANAACIANTGSNATTFLPVFPASCPYVTSVGMTLGIEAQTPSSASGAGFSYYFDRPAYQDTAVSAYLAGPANPDETELQSAMYNHRGRAYPDITAVGGGAFFDYFFNRWDIGGGTSAAVPTAASMVALLNA
ncbi:peptidase S8/S53 domain-containing protein [Mycena galopus ATCC 62051]|nr:peptidase S8/S53 domain-containing protein [Mycena galopus ATCC 62051]